MPASRPAPGDAEAAALAAAWLPTDDPDARTQLAALFCRLARLGLDPAATMRDALGRWFGGAAGTALPTVAEAEPQPGQAGEDPATMPLLPLAGLRPPTLWPQRPRRQPDELFSSWLRRTAIAAGVPPRGFAREVLGSGQVDPDRTVSALTLRRLALASGHAPDDLAAGTLWPHAHAGTGRGMIEDAALAHGGLLLLDQRPGRRAAGVQFCPLCLGAQACPPFRRGWRFGYEVACPDHACLLHDRCPRCGAAVLPLQPRSTDPQPGCPACGLVLCEARPVRAIGSAARQRALLARLQRLVVDGDPDRLDEAMARLAATLADAGTAVRARAAALAALRPALPSPTPRPAKAQRRPVVLARRRPAAPPAAGRR